MELVGKTRLGPRLKGRDGEKWPAHKQDLELRSLSSSSENFNQVAWVPGYFNLFGKLKVERVTSEWW